MQGHEGRICMGAILHARFVAAEERRRDPLGKGEIPERAAALECFDHDLGGFQVTRIALVGLQIHLGGVCGIRLAAINKSEFLRQLDKTRDFGGIQEVADF